MAGQGSSKHHKHIRIKNPVFNARVSYPITDSSSVEIRNNILLDFFDYTEEDIKTLDEQKKGFFFINDKSFPDRWATGEEVKSWAFNPDGTVKIDMPQTLIDTLISYRTQRASLEIYKVGMFITDTETRKNITDDLENILSSSGVNRTSAFNNLMMTIAGSATSRGEIYKALRFLTNESGYKDNPFLQIAFAGTTAYKSETPAWGSSAMDQTAIAKAVAEANQSLYNENTKSSLTKITRQEAAQINHWASVLYDNVNANDQATDSRWMERILSMPKTERQKLKEGDVYSIANPNEVSMRGLFPSERDSQNAAQEFDATVKNWDEIDQIGKDQSFDLKGDHRQSEYYQKETDVRATGSKIVPANDPAHNVKRIPDKFRSVYPNAEVDGVMAPIGLYLEYSKWRTVNERMKVITEYLRKRDILEARVRRDNYRIVPPPPQVIKQYIKDFQRDGRIATSPFQTQIIGILSELERLLKESNAFYAAEK